MRFIRKKFRIVKRFLANSPIARRAVIVCCSLLALALLIFSMLFFKQRGFEKDVHAAQKQATEQIQKRSNKKKITADYSAADVHTLNPNDLKKVNPTEQVNQFGVGLLEIPAISMKLPILEGSTQANLSIGAGTTKENQALGKGNFVLLGHYMTNRGLLFGGIKYLQKGNDIKVTYRDKQAEYVVTETKIISKKEVQYMEDSKDNPKILTLITCDSSNQNTPNRLIVIAKLKK
ncbi:class A sortase [Enterococcus sp. DIV0187]|uniref:class A sortase n=1 Tax=Enterococcus sp. DIV0187 TaxID=2774644 RepID=UPI003F2633EF